MIESIIKRFQDAGFTVYVREGVLRIEKVISGEILALNWMIPPEDLTQLPAEVLFMQADHRIWQLEQAIAEKEGRFNHGKQKASRLSEGSRIHIEERGRLQRSSQRNPGE